MAELRNSRYSGPELLAHFPRALDCVTCKSQVNSNWTARLEISKRAVLARRLGRFSDRAPFTALFIGKDPLLLAARHRLVQAGLADATTTKTDQQLALQPALPFTRDHSASAPMATVQPPSPTKAVTGMPHSESTAVAGQANRIKMQRSTGALLLVDCDDSHLTET